MVESQVRLLRVIKGYCCTLSPGAPFPGRRRTEAPRVMNTEHPKGDIIITSTCDTAVRRQGQGISPLLKTSSSPLRDPPEKNKPFLPLLLACPAPPALHGQGDPGAAVPHVGRGVALGELWVTQVG